MPGLILAFTPPGAAANSRALVDSLTKAMFPAEGHAARSVWNDPTCAAAFVVGPKDLAASRELSGSNWAWFGNPHLDGQSLDRASADSFPPSTSESDLARFATRLTGHFQLAVHSHATGANESESLTLITDRTGTMPWYVARFGESWLVLTEPLSLKAFRSAGMNLSLRKQAVWEFMVSGHLWGDGAYWNEVRRVGPAHIVTLNAKQPQSRHSFYWRMPEPPFAHDAGQLRQQLTAAIERDLDELPPGKATLTLSGGLDSR